MLRPPGPRPLDVLGVGPGDGAEALLVGESLCEVLIEGGGLLIRDRAHLREGLVGTAHGAARHLPGLGRDVEQVAGRLDDDQPITLLEGGCQLGVDPGQLIAPVDELHAGLKSCQAVHCPPSVAPAGRRRDPPVDLTRRPARGRRP